MIKLSKIYEYGNPMSGQSWFDDETTIPIIRDPDTKEDWVAPFFAGVNSVVSPTGESTSPAHQTLVKAHMPAHISEFASNSLSHNDEALKAYLVRYAKTLNDYKKKHGKYPKQRVIGHSRGGGGALEFMEALAKEHPELPRVDEYIGLDPYDTPFASKKNVRTGSKGNGFVARRSIIVRPKRPGAIISDPSDMDGDGRVSMKERLYSHLSNLLVQFGRRMNPMSRSSSSGIAVPGVHHSSANEMLAAAMEARKAKSKRDLKKRLLKMYGDQDPALIESGDSPLYGDYSSPVYEKAASANGKRDFSGAESIVDGFMKEAAISWRPWNWGKDATKTDVGYGANWRDFFGHLGDNLKSAPARAGQIASHGVTDTASGLADFVSRDAGNAIRKWQKSMDRTYDSMMSPEMRAEYRDNKTGRALGELGSLAIGAALPMPSGGKLFAKLPGAARAARIARVSNKLNTPGAKLLHALGIGIRKAPLSGKGGRLVGKLLQKATPSTAAHLGSAVNVLGHIRGRDLATRLDRDYAGDVNPVMRVLDKVNELGRRRRARWGSDLANDENLPMMRLYDKRYRGNDWDPVDILNKGKQIFMTGADGQFLRDAKGNYIPVKAENAAAAKSIQRAMSDAKAHAASKASGAFSTGIFGKLLNRSQPQFADSPGFKFDDSGKLVGFIPRPRVDENGEIIKDRPIGGRVGAALGFAGDILAYSNPYTALPALATDLHDMIQTKNYGNAAGLALSLGSSRVPGLKHMARWATRSRYLPRNYSPTLRRFIERNFYKRLGNVVGRNVLDKGTRFVGVPMASGIAQPVAGALTGGAVPMPDANAMGMAGRELVMGRAAEILQTARKSMAPEEFKNWVRSEFNPMMAEIIGRPYRPSDAGYFYRTAN